MKCEWDERKNRSNLRKHGLSLALAEEAFDDPNAYITEDYIDENGEMRYQTTALVGGELILAIFVDRGDAVAPIPRIISLRKATSYEQEIYFFNARGPRGNDKAPGRDDR